MILLDTCAIVWLLLEPAMLSKAAKKAISFAREDGELSISDVTFSELAWLVKNQRIALNVSLEAFLSEVSSLCSPIRITPAIARLSVEFPASYPKDPMDRIIGATALDRGMPLVTKDIAIRKSKAVPVIW